MDGAALTLRRLVEEQARDPSREAFARFMDQLYDHITTLLESNEFSENMGALRVIDELIDVTISENASKVEKLSNYMRSAFETKCEPEFFVLASKVLGHLARSGGAMTADEVEHQVEVALEWLRGERIEYRRFAAVLILKEMAENASTVFNVHVPEFVDAIWVAVRDPMLAVREKAVEALRACLCVIEKRETRWRVQWYYRMFEATKDGLAINEPVHSIHGSLLAVGELLRFLGDGWLHEEGGGRGTSASYWRNTGEFMMSRYREVAEIVLSYLEHQDDLVRLSITSLLPRIAHFLRDRFVTNYLTVCMNHILHVLKIPAERASGLIALGEMAGALDGELINYLPTIISHLRDAIAPQRGRPSLEALACVGNIAKAMGPTMEPHVRGLLDCMFSAGLSLTLVEVLEQISESIPPLLPTIQDWLLECISVILSRSHHAMSRQSAALSRGHLETVTSQVPELSGSALVQLALETLARFNFKGHDLLEFARESVVVYLEDEDGTTRKDAALCCCKLVANSFLAMSSTQFSPSRINRASGKRRRLVEGDYNGGLGKGKLTVYLVIVQKLLIAAVADADVTVRHSVFSSLYADGGFDEFLAQDDSLITIFATLNDEDFEVREYAISLAGRLSEKNPAYVLPALRRHLSQLLTYLERWFLCIVETPDSRFLSLLYSLQGGIAMRQYISELMPLIIEALLDPAAVTKREVAVSTLGQVVQSTGYVITPYNEYPRLLELLLKLLNGELAWSTRREVLKVLGIMGALDPHVHKRNQQSVSGSHGEVTGVTGDPGQHRRSMDELPMDHWPSFATSEEYYSSVAINSLMRILRDPSLSSYHQEVVGSLMFIFKSMGSGCVPYLPKGVTNSSPDSPCPSDPPILHLMRWNALLGTQRSTQKVSSDILPVVFKFLLMRRVHLKWVKADDRTWCSQTLAKLVPRVRTELFVPDKALYYDFVTLFCFVLIYLIAPFNSQRQRELRKDAIDALCCLAHALGEETSPFYSFYSGLCWEVEEIQGRLEKHEPLILSTTAQRFIGGSRLRSSVNGGRLCTAGEASQRSTKEDWAEWMRHFRIELLKESPSPALRTCARLAQLQPFVVRELFAAGFVSCWSQLNEASQRQLVRSLEMAFSSPNIPPEILATLLNLAESMEHDERPLPIDIRLLGALAEKVGLFSHCTVD
ncbi:hypothetical protein HAX54_012899 [Datura stramonium]|uniref:Serine/threonine-protein kinase TOR n=1 Tax=Datura stramonium TaxID=4076 RepID=A0ABS8RY10_DATST|nr:hypothetical protein [Datura stramonium]